MQKKIVAVSFVVSGKKKKKEKYKIYRLDILKEFV